MRAVDKNVMVHPATRGQDMARYNLYFLKDNRLLGNESIEADDDNDAAGIAATRAEGQTIEVWNGRSRVRVVTPNAGLRS